MSEKKNYWTQAIGTQDAIIQFGGVSSEKDVRSSFKVRALDGNHFFTMDQDGQRKGGQGHLPLDPVLYAFALRALPPHPLHRDAVPRPRNLLLAAQRADAARLPVLRLLLLGHEAWALVVYHLRYLLHRSHARVGCL